MEPRRLHQLGESMAHLCFFAVLRVFWRAANVGVPDFHHVRPGDAASRAASAAGPHPATTVPFLHPELPEWQRALR